MSGVVGRQSRGRWATKSQRVSPPATTRHSSELTCTGPTGVPPCILERLRALMVCACTASRLQEYHAQAPGIHGARRRAVHGECLSRWRPFSCRRSSAHPTITAAPRPTPPPTRFGGTARSFETEARGKHRKLQSPPCYLTESRRRLSLEAQHGRRRGRAAAHGPGGPQAEPGDVKEQQLDLDFGDNLEIATQDAAWAAKRRLWRSAWAQTAAAWCARRTGVHDASAPRP